MEDDTLGDLGISTEGSRNVSLRVGDYSSQQDAGTPAGPIARSGQDAETQSKDPYAVLRPSERPPPVLYQGIGPCSRPVHSEANKNVGLVYEVSNLNNEYQFQLVSI